MLLRLLSPHRVALSLKNRIILLTCVSVLMSTLVIGGLTYFQIEGIVFKTATEKLPRETALLAQRFKLPYDALRSDALVLSEAPPVTGIIRSLRGAGVDPQDGSTTKIWRDRLATNFSSLMHARPHYLQIRYIGISDNGREIVRVNRTIDGVEIVADDKLQQKGGEPYFKRNINTRRNEVHFSDVSYNRENGQIDAALIPTLRVGTPVFDENNNVFGMIIINAEYDLMLRRAFEEIAPRSNTFVVNGAGDYMEYTEQGTISALELHDDYSRPPRHFIQQIVASKAESEMFTSTTAVSYFIRLNIDPGNPDAFLGVALRVPYDELLAPAHEARAVSLVWGGGLTVLCILVSFALARSFTAPIVRMAAEIKRSGDRDMPQNLPLTRLDEIGDLARAFDRKTRRLSDIETKASAVINNVVDGLVTIDEMGIVDSYNPACERIFGYTPDEVVGQNVSMLMPQPHHEAHDQYLAKYRSTGKRHIIGARRELEGRHKDGSTFPLELAVSELHLDTKRMFSGIIRDISERRMMEVMKNEFVSTVNHELRTPLTSIQGALGLLMAKYDAGADAKALKLLQLSYDNCQRLSRLVNDILDVEKIAAGKMDYRMETTKLCALVGNIVDSQTSYAEKFGVTFQIFFEMEDIDVYLDKDRFAQALVNLLSNAAKFSKPGDQVEIIVSPVSAQKALISVIDHGPVIPEAFRSKIFGKFAQADSSATRAKGGSGLGLNITKTIIEAFGGAVTYESYEGQGSKFDLTLPLVSRAKRRA